MARTMTILNQIKHPSTHRHYTTLAVHSISDPPIHPQTLHYICCISPTRPPTACPHPLTPVRSVQAAGSLSDHLIGEEGHRQCPKTVDGDRSRAYRIVHRRCPCHRLRPAVQSRPVKQPFSAHASSDQAIKVGLGRVRSGVLRYGYRSLPPPNPPPQPPALRHPDIYPTPPLPPYCSEYQLLKFKDTHRFIFVLFWFDVKASNGGACSVVVLCLVGM